MQQKLAAELLGKEEIVNKMQIQLRELTKNIKLKWVDIISLSILGEHFETRHKRPKLMQI